MNSNATDGQLVTGNDNDVDDEFHPPEDEPIDFRPHMQIPKVEFLVGDPMITPRSRSRWKRFPLADIMKSRAWQPLVHGDGFPAEEFKAFLDDLVDFGGGGGCGDGDVSTVSSTHGMENDVIEIDYERNTCSHVL